MNRLVIFAHYNKLNKVEEYVYYYLNELKQISNNIIFVTTSNFNEDNHIRLKQICDKIIIRENILYDFGSWKLGINSTPDVSDYDELIICNDSVYGPLFPLKDIFIKMQNKKCDFWGITESYEIKYHIQSYFVVFRKILLNSKAFHEFWNSIKSEMTREEIIKKCEIGLTQSLMQSGFKQCSYIRYPFTLILKENIISIIKRPIQSLRTLLYKPNIKRHFYINPTHPLWKYMITKYQMPFLKIKLVHDNLAKTNIEEFEAILKEYTNYDSELIKKHLSNHE